MKQNCFSITDKNAYLHAGEDDLIILEPAKGSNTPFIPRAVVEIVGYGILKPKKKSFMHISGGTGSAKSLFISAMLRNPKNTSYLAQWLDFPYRPIKLTVADMTEFDAPSEIRSRRSLRAMDGATETYDEDSVIVTALKDAARQPDKYNHVIWLQEIGRIVNPHIQSSILNLMSKDDLILKDGSVVPAGSVCWMFDSNLIATETGSYVLSKFDDAFKRRQDVQIELHYLDVAQEIAVMEYLVQKSMPEKEVDITLIEQLVKLGTSVRTLKDKGQLLSIASPSLYGYTSAYEHIKDLTGLSTAKILKNNFLGNCTTEDKKQVDSLINKIFFTFNFSKKNSFQPQTF